MTKNINLSYYQKNKKSILAKAKEYYEKNKEAKEKQARYRYYSSPEEKQRKIEYGKIKYHNKSE